jgi:hypothetical protein
MKCRITVREEGCDYIREEVEAPSVKAALAIGVARAEEPSGDYGDGLTTFNGVGCRL